jgi:hypothetical protein
VAITVHADGGPAVSVTFNAHTPDGLWAGNDLAVNVLTTSAARILETLELPVEPWGQDDPVLFASRILLAQARDASADAYLSLRLSELYTLAEWALAHDAQIAWG